MRPVKFSREKVLALFYERKVLSKDELLNHSGCSSMTAWRILRHHGYLSSYNRNASCYTLADIPKFDKFGLWKYKGACFSRQGSLTVTVTELVRRSSGGMSSKELERVSGIKNLKPLLCKLTGKSLVTREVTEGTLIYFASDCKIAAAQRQFRQKELAGNIRRLSLPAPEKTIAVLVELIKQPGRSAGQLAAVLRRKGVEITREEIKLIFRYYDLPQKKT